MLQRMQVPNNALECQTTPLDVEAETSMLNDEVDRDKVINGVQLYLLPDTKLRKNVIQLVFVCDLTRDLTEVMQASTDIKS